MANAGATVCTPFVRPLPKPVESCKWLRYPGNTDSSKVKFLYAARFLRNISFFASGVVDVEVFRMVVTECLRASIE